MTSCGQKSDVDNAQGAVRVDVPLQKNSETFTFKTIQLFGIDSLKEVSGKFVQFFYTPGAEGSTIVGDAPKARFIKKGDRFIPMDAISNRMSVIYYHLQNMAQLDDLVGAAGINHWPRVVGLDTILANVSESDKKNNAFYDGYTDSMMFLPYTANELPIAANGGVIAHEHFHSLFYKIVMKPALKNKNLNLNQKQVASIHDFKAQNDRVVFRGAKILPANLELNNSQVASLVNRADLMGINEGLADFWAWIYSDDANYIRWSIPSEKVARSLELDQQEEGHFKSTLDIKTYIRYLQNVSLNPSENLSSYYYIIGTPHARFLRQLTLVMSEESKQNVSEVKVKVAGKVIQFLQSLSKQVAEAQSEQVLNADSLFAFFSEDQSLANTKACDLVLKYVNKKSCGATTHP